MKLFVRNKASRIDLPAAICSHIESQWGPIRIQIVDLNYWAVEKFHNSKKLTFENYQFFVANKSGIGMLFAIKGAAARCFIPPQFCTITNYLERAGIKSDVGSLKAVVSPQVTSLVALNNWMFRTKLLAQLILHRAPCISGPAAR